jgi:GNAT superfamily N-acetyltransferase
MIITPASPNDLLDGWRRHWSGETIVTFAVEDSLGELVTLNPERQRQGIGTALMEAAAKALGETAETGQLIRQGLKELAK